MRGEEATPGEIRRDGEGRNLKAPQKPVNLEPAWVDGANLSVAVPGRLQDQKGF